MEIEGPGHFGKTEARYVLDAEPGAKLIAGIESGTSAQALAESMRAGAILEHVPYQPVRAGDTMFMPAGTIHALGPGMLVYEVQQTSDWTYRIYDWGRPETETRKLHIEKSLAVSRADARTQAEPFEPLADGDFRTLTQCNYFTLSILGGENKSISRDTKNESFQAITIIEGEAEIVTADEKAILSRFDSALIPAICGGYKIRPHGRYRALLAFA